MTMQSVLYRSLALLPSLMLALVAQPALAGNVLYVSGNTTPNAADQNVIDHLEGLGHTVSHVQANDSATSDATGKDLIVISSTVTSGQVNTKFRTVPTGILNWESALWDDFLYSTAAGN